ncbi:MAG: hypothetical protein ABSE73_01365 [Planctomycetota bacterium]
MKGLNRWWLVTFGIVLVLLIVIAAVRGRAKLELGGEQSLVLRVAPGTPHTDPGPAYIVGAESDPEGTRFATADFFIEGLGDWRVYFDRRDNANFHFLDRAGDMVALGLSEAGVEQILATGKLESVAQLRLARHGSQIGLFQQGKLVAAAFDDRLAGGTAGFRMGQSELPITLRAEPREDIHFADDFMITDVKSAQWRGNGTPERGDFAVKSLKNPLLSANAFCYMGAGANIHSVVGQPWWDRYSYEASVRGPVGGCIGLVFAYQNERNYGLFRWSVRKTAADGVKLLDAGKRELLRVSGGVEEVLATAPGGYVPDQWYSARVLMTYSRVNLSMDGHVLMEVSDPYLAAGGAGVWCDVPLPATPAEDPKAQLFQVNSLDALMRQHAVFDDIRINTLDGIDDDFRVPGPLAGGWLAGPGDWLVSPDQSGSGSGVLQILAQAGATKALIGDRRWAQYEVEADVQPGSGGAGIVFLHRDENDYYTATLEQGQLRLNCVAEGRAAVVDSVRLEDAGATPHFKACIKHGHVRAEVSTGWNRVGRSGEERHGTEEATLPTVGSKHFRVFCRRAEV